MTMSVPEMVSLYAPLAGLLAVVFYLGVLSERVKTLSVKIVELRKELEKHVEVLHGRVDGVGAAGGADQNKITRLDVQVENLARQQESILRSLEGIQRQLANLIQQGAPRTFRVLNPPVDGEEVG